MIETLQADTLKNLSGVHHGFYTRQGGVSGGVFASLNCGVSGYDDQALVQENRRRVAAHCGVVAENLLSCYQIHSATVVTVTRSWLAADRPRADAMVTREKGLALGVLTADCVPVLLADAKAGVVGAAHAGWRGAIAGVVENTVKAMEALGAKRGDIAAALGPCIGQFSYEVGPDFPAPFLAEDPTHERFFRPAFRSDHYMFDLPAYVMGKLAALGIPAIAPPPADTARDETRFFSYRRNTLAGETRVGSLIAVVGLK